MRLDAAALQPVSAVLLPIAQAALHHKSNDVAAAAFAVLVRLAAIEPAACGALALESLHASLRSHDAVHQLDQSINLLAGALPLPHALALRLRSSAIKGVKRGEAAPQRCGARFRRGDSIALLPALM